MAETADVVVIGGGITGASTAFHLAAAGVRDVLVLDRGRLGAGSTARAMGGVRAQFAAPLHIQMSRFSISAFERFSDLTGGRSGYVPAGYLLLGTTPLHMQRLGEIAELQRDAGLDDVEALGPGDIERLLPFLDTSDVLGGAFRQRDGFVDPAGVLQGFTDAARRAGCRFREGSPVIGIRTSAGAVVGVDTPAGAIEAPCVVNAAGAWSAGVAALAGLRLPVRPLRRQIVRTAPVQRLPPALPMVIDLTDGFHFRPDPRDDGASALRIAGPDTQEVHGFDTTPDAAFMDSAMAWARRRAGGLGPLSPDRERCSAGLYAMTPDHHAILGEESGLVGFFEANGFSGHGVMHSPATGVIVAELITTGRSASFPDATRLGPGRFAAGGLLTEPAVF